jgi:hypothetical protein
MDLDRLSNIAEIVGAIVVVGGIGFAAVELLHYRRQRLELATIELGRSFESPEFARALRQVLSLPAGLTGKEVSARGPELEDAALLVTLMIESTGVMVRHKVVDIQIVWEMMGGVVMSSWERLSGWVADIRATQGSQKFAEWFEWLDAELRRKYAPGP